MFVLNPKYDPTLDHERLGMPTIFKDANSFVYDVLLKTVKPRRAKKIVEKYEFDGQRAYGALMEYYKGKSAHAAKVAGDILTAINTFDMPIKSRCNQPDKAYIGDLMELIDQYQDSVPDANRLTDKDISRYFYNFVRRVPEFHFITAVIKMHELQGTTFTEEQMVEQYEGYAELAEGYSPRNVSLDATSTNMSQIMVNQVDAGYPTDFDINEFVWDDSNSYDIFESDVRRPNRLPDSLWTIMSDKDRRSWIGISPNGRADIVGFYASPASVRGDGPDDTVRSGNRNKTSAHKSKIGKVKPATPKSALKPRPTLRNVDFHDIEEDTDAEDDEEAVAEAGKWSINMSLLSAIRDPTMVQNADIAIKKPGGVESNDILMILSDKNDVNRKNPKMLRDVYGEDESDDDEVKSITSHLKQKAAAAVSSFIPPIVENTSPTWHV